MFKTSIIAKSLFRTARKYRRGQMIRNIEAEFPSFIGLLT